MSHVIKFYTVLNCVKHTVYIKLKEGQYLYELFALSIQSFFIIVIQ